MGMKAAIPFLVMVMAECTQVGLLIISKIAMSKGMSSFIFVFYSNALASLVLLPSSLLFHRSERPPLTFPIICGFFVLGLSGCLANFFGYAGINLSSPTLGTSMLNLVPGLTFILAVAFRMEKLNWRTSSTLAKSIGTIVSVGGAFILTYYKGPPVLMTPPLNTSHGLLVQLSNWVIGGLLLVVDCVMTSAWIIIQAFILKKYPAELIAVFFYCFFVTIQSAIVCLIIERDLSAWSLRPNIRLVAVLYSGVFGSAFQIGISSWCLRQKGPVFVSMFKPLGVVIAAALGIIFLGDTLYLGCHFHILIQGTCHLPNQTLCSLAGATVIVIGFYAVLWGKANEHKMGIDAGAKTIESSSQRVPLLQGYIEEI